MASASSVNKFKKTALTEVLSLPFRPLLALLEGVGFTAICLIKTLFYMTKGKVKWPEVIAQTASVGVDSAPVAIAISTIAGSVLALQIAARFAQNGADSYVGGLVALAIIREIGPIFTALAVGARAGTAITSEIANMKVTEQIDALSVMHVDPVRYLFVPRVFACVLSLPLLNIIGSFVAIVSGMFIAKSITHLHFNKYLDSIWLFVNPYDLRVSIGKSIIFGLLISVICCTLGLITRGGAREVGTSTTRAAVWTSVTILITDFLLTWIFFGNSPTDI